MRGNHVLSNLNIRAGQAVSAQRMDGFLTELRSRSETARPVATLYFPGEAAHDNSATMALSRDRSPGSWITALEQAGSRVLRSPTGVVAFRVGNAGVAVLPPFPLNDMWTGDIIYDWPLRTMLSSQLTIGVALVRLGRYAIAVYEGQKLVASKTDTRYVKGKHHAGGTSQRRFQRVRENQIHRLYAEASGVLEAQWRPWADRFDYVVLGGEAATVNGFVQECRMLSRLSAITLERRLDVREPNRASLDEVGAMLYQCRLYPLIWPEQGSGEPLVI